MDGDFLSFLASQQTDPGGKLTPFEIEDWQRKILEQLDRPYAPVVVVISRSQKRAMERVWLLAQRRLRARIELLRRARNWRRRRRRR